jgi:hypothetical protein
MNPTSGTAGKPLRITIDNHDNVAIVVNSGGLPAGTVFDDGLVLIPMPMDLQARATSSPFPPACSAWPA